MLVNILEAKTTLSKLVRLVVTGREDMTAIVRNGKLVSKSSYSMICWLQSMLVRQHYMIIC